MKPSSNEASNNSVVHVVDDDPAIRDAIKDLLDCVSLQSKAYASAKEFFGSNLSDQTSCLILDVRLPELSGFDFKNELARRHINIPIIFITGYGDVRMSVEAMK